MAYPSAAVATTNKIPLKSLILRSSVLTLNVPQAFSSPTTGVYVMIIGSVSALVTMRRPYVDAKLQIPVPIVFGLPGTLYAS